MSRGIDFASEPYDNHLFGQHYAAVPMGPQSDFLSEIETTKPSATIPPMGSELPWLSELTPTQDITLIVLQVLSSTLSLIGSCIIIFKILRKSCQKQASTTPYDRIILGLSSCDVLMSFTFMVGPFLLPSDTSRRSSAIGNDSTCTHLGFLLQLSCFWAVWYNCILSFYYLLTVRFKVKRKDFCKKYEKWMHLSGAIFFPTTATLGLFGQWYQEERFAMVCWIGEVPKNCEENGGTCIGTYIGVSFGAAPAVFTLIALIVNNIIIYVHVRKSLLSPTPLTTGNGDTIDAENTKSKGENETSAERQSVQRELRKEAAVQGFLYVVTFVLTFVPCFIVNIIETIVPYGMEDPVALYPLLVATSTLVPLQGFFNVFVYVRPSYTRFRAANPDKSVLFVLKQALFNPKIPKMNDAVRASSTGIATPSVERKYSSMRRKSGSNFSMSLDNIIEEESCSDEEGVSLGDVIEEEESVNDGLDKDDENMQSGFTDSQSSHTSS